MQTVCGHGDGIVVRRSGPLKRTSGLRRRAVGLAPFHAWRGQYKTCVVDDCDRSIVARGLCGKHYQRWQSNGDATITRAGQPKRQQRCAECGKIYEVYASQIRHRGSRWCSMECANQARRAKVSAREKACKQCGKMFSPEAKAVGRLDAGKFCSRTCYAAWVQAQERRRVVGCCPVCGTTFDRPRAWGKPVYCSKICQAEGRVRPGSEKSRGRGWRKLRDRVRERDGYLCVRCEAAEDGRRHAVDHIVPWVLVKEDQTRANDEANLATLCARCHGVKTAVTEPRLFRGDVAALYEFYGHKRADAAMTAVWSQS